MKTLKKYESTPDFLLKSFELAKKHYKNSYCKYSNFQVSAVVKAVDHDELFVGVNVENASFGGTICAERTAITSMVTHLGGDVEIDYILIMTKDVSSACLICQQFMTEFSKGKPINLYLADENKVAKLFESNVGFHLH